MAEEKKYLVKGEFEGEEINETVFAYSGKQAKLKVGMNNGIGGKRMREFMSSSRVSSVRKL